MKRRHISEMTQEEMHEMRSKAVSAVVDYANKKGFSGLSHAGWFSFYSAIEDAIEAEWNKAKKHPNEIKVAEGSR